jgi:hypothetical protein
MTGLRALVAVTAAVLTIGAAPAWAQGAAQKKKQQAPRKVLKPDELKVLGRVHKPQAVFLTPRANPTHSEPSQSEPLLPKVTKAVEKDPF